MIDSILNSVVDDFYSLDEVTQLYTAIIESGAAVVRCSLTGEALQTLTPVEVASFVAMYVQTRKGVDFKLNLDDAMDEIQLRMLAVNSRPQISLIGINSDTYAALARVRPATLTRFLLGRVFFDALYMTRLHGTTELQASKMAFLESYQDLDPSDENTSELLKILIRLDAVFAVRSALLTNDVRKEADSLVKSTPSVKVLLDFFLRVEQRNMQVLSKRDTRLEGRLIGNPQAHEAMFASLSELTPEQIADWVAREEAAERETQSRRKRIAEQAAKAAASAGNGRVVVKRGLDAVVSLIKNGDVVNKEVALNMLSRLNAGKAALAEKRINAAFGLKADKPKTQKPSKPKSVKGLTLNVSLTDTDF